MIRSELFYIFCPPMLRISVAFLRVEGWPQGWNVLVPAILLTTNTTQCVWVAGPSPHLILDQNEGYWNGTSSRSWFTKKLDLDLFAFPKKFPNFRKVFVIKNCFRGAWKSSLHSSVYFLSTSTFKKPTVLIRALSFLGNSVSLCPVKPVSGVDIAATRLTERLNEWL